ncbi:MAG: electron transport complex subunit RsxA [bacterium]
MKLVLLAISAALVNNIILARFLGICPFLGVSRKIDTAVGMGMAVTFVMTMASIVVWFVQDFILAPLRIEYLQIVSFILVIAALVQLVEMFIQKVSPVLYQALGIYLPLITTNCAVLGVVLINVQDREKYVGLPEMAVNGFSVAVGYALAIFLFAGMRERLALVEIPKPLRGTPIALITVGLLSLAFMGFSGLVK